MLDSDLDIKQQGVFGGVPIDPIYQPAEEKTVLTQEIVLGGPKPPQWKSLQPSYKMIQCNLFTHYSQKLLKQKN